VLPVYPAGGCPKQPPAPIFAGAFRHDFRESASRRLPAAAWGGTVDRPPQVRRSDTGRPPRLPPAAAAPAMRLPPDAASLQQIGRSWSPAPQVPASSSEPAARCGRLPPVQTVCWDPSGAVPPWGAGWSGRQPQVRRSMLAAAVSPSHGGGQDCGGGARYFCRSFAPVPWRLACV